MMRLMFANKSKGFTLIELVMTIVVVGIVGVPLALSIGQQVYSTVQSGAYTKALNLARYEMEILNNTAFASIATASYPSFQGYPYNVTVTVTYAQGTSSSTESLKLIVVSVTQTGSATVLASLTTYMAKNITTYV